MNPAISFLAAELKSKLSSKNIQAAFSGLAHVAVSPAVQTSGKKITAAAVQLQIMPYSRLPLLVHDINRYMQAASNKGAQLICFPEFSGLLPAFVSSGAQLGLSYLNSKSMQKLLAEQGASNATHKIINYISPFNFVADAYIEIMSTFAKKYNVYISCGTCLVVQNGKLYNRHVMLSPSGEVLGTQDKIHLTEEELNFGFSSADTLGIIKTPIGNIALMVCMDATYFEPFKIAKQLGADYAIVPIGNIEEFNHHLALRGVPSRVSETGLIAIKSALVSKETFPVKSTGKAGIYFPLESTQKSREAATHSKPEVVISEIDLSAARLFESEYFGKPNRAFNESYYNALVDFSSVQHSINKT